MSDRVHILHIIDALDYGGAQKLLVTLVRHTPADRFKVSVCCLQPKVELKGEIEAQGVRPLCLNRRRPSVLQPHRLLAYTFQNIRDVVRFCRRERVQVIQCHLSDAEFIGIAAGALCRIRRIIPMNHFPFVPSGRSRGDLRNLLRRLSCRILYNWLCASVIAVSTDTAERLISHFEVDPKKIQVITNGVDMDVSHSAVGNGLREALGIISDSKVVLAVGRLTRQKGHVYLIEAVARLKEEFPTLKVLIAGDGELKEILDSRCKELGVQDRVLFLGNRKDVPDLLAVSDLFVMPSLWEGTSLALLEAMASATAVLATDEPGNSGIIRHMENGYLVPAASPDHLSEGIAFLLSRPDVALQLGQKAREAVREGYDARRMIAEMEPLWLGAGFGGAEPN